jgi:hypothetical protein
MPAVELVRLQNDTRRLLEHFHEPPVFVPMLQELLEFFSDRTARPGQSGAPRPLLRAYNVPHHLQTYMTREVCKQAANQPQAGLALAQALWAADYLELRLMAAAMLGSLSPSPPEPLLAVIEAWLAQQPEARLQQAILNEGLASLRRQQPQALLAKIETWIKSSRNPLRQTGLAALAILVDASSAEVPPQVFELLQPLFYQLPDELKQDILDLVRSLARRLPAETAYLLRQGLDTPHNAKPAWLLRNAMDSFPESMQPGLREGLRKATR